jgi:hypothetical protein
MTFEVCGHRSGDTLERCPWCGLLRVCSQCGEAVHLDRCPALPQWIFFYRWLYERDDANRCASPR